MKSNGDNAVLEAARPATVDDAQPVGFAVEVFAGAAEEVLRRVMSRVPMIAPPDATYRLQFHKDFTFRNAADIVPYLHELGISHVYASPYLKSRSGSTHGYDVVDHGRLNPELGDEADFSRFTAALAAHNMSHVLDIVPNHMGIGSDENAWWNDVLENGAASQFAAFFDIDWKPLKSDLAGKVLLPVLGDQYGATLEEGRLKLHFAGGTFHLSYYQRQFPIAPKTYQRVLGHRLDELRSRLPADDPALQEYESILTAIGHLPSRDSADPALLHERQREKEIIKRRLHRLCDDSSVVAQFIAENVAAFNGEPGRPESFNLLDDLLQDQAYRLSYWRVAADEINYRRFFDVNELAALSMERDDVFEKSHVLVEKLLSYGVLAGLRIDHADGLFAPAEYLWKLQKLRFLQLCREEHAAAAAPDVPAWDWIAPHIAQRYDELRRQEPGNRALQPLYLAAEKILEGKEPLPADWPVDGTTGYEFLHYVNGLFLSPAGIAPLDRCYSRFIAAKPDFGELVYGAKRLIMKVSMAGELNALGHQLDRISEQSRRSRDFTLNGLTLALREIVSCFTVYRTYTTAGGILDRDRRYVEQAVARAKRRNPALSAAEFDFIRDVLLLNVPFVHDREAVLRFVGRFQQFTGPLMAKSVEDTAYYNYHRLVSLNEVGGDPVSGGCTVAAFHQFNARRRNSHPHALSATATHDTKRGEDTRARINLLSEIPDAWKDCVQRWARWNKRKKQKIDGEWAPARNDEYLFYQTLVGTWPFDPPRGPALEAYVGRLQQYAIKALREAKVHSSWIQPNEAYERATCDFIAAVLAEEPSTAFRADFEPLVALIAAAGVWNSLAQTVLKLTSPGVPDVYQGTELWDFSLVDPDNRRPVDYAARTWLLRELRAATMAAADRLSFIGGMISNCRDDRLKLFVASELLAARRKLPALFARGSYSPLEVHGQRADHVVAFARRHEDDWAIVAVPRLAASIVRELGRPPLGDEIWTDTVVVPPPEAAGLKFYNRFTDESWEMPLDGLPAAAIFGSFPVAVLTNRRTGPTLDA